MTGGQPLMKGHSRALSVIRNCWQRWASGFRDRIAGRLSLLPSFTALWTAAIIPPATEAGGRNTADSGNLVRWEGTR